MSEASLQQETFDAFYADALPLLRRHWREIAHYPDIALDPDVDRYHAIEDAGNLRVFTARVMGRLVGYALFFVHPNLHYRSSVQAVADVIYVDPDHRRSTIGLRLLAYTEAALKAEGVQAVYHHVKANHAGLGKILERTGYDLIDLIYAKRLDAVAQTEPVRRMETEEV